MVPIFLPKNFDGRKHMQQWSRKLPADPVIDPDVMEYLVHMIFRKYSFFDAYQEEHKGYVPLYSLVLKRVSTHYSKHLRYLEDTQVIFIDRSYSTETGKTKAYRLRAKYKFADTAVKQLTNRRIRRVHKNLGAYEAKHLKEVERQYPYLTKPFEGVHIGNHGAASSTLDV